MCLMSVICSTFLSERDSFFAHARLIMPSNSHLGIQNQLRYLRNAKPARWKPFLEAVVVNTLRSLIVVVWSCHVTLALTLINNKNDFGGDLSSKE